jgi:hypothetical protein
MPKMCPAGGDKLFLKVESQLYSQCEAAVRAPFMAVVLLDV